jgi:hypothetical protein
MPLRAPTSLKAVPALALAAVLVAGCGGSSSGASSAASTSASQSTSTSQSAPAAATSQPPSSTTSSSAAEPTYTVTVVGKKVTGVANRVTLTPGEKVRLVLTADRSSELHIHAGSPEIESHTKMGQAVTFDFTAKKQPGLYEVEMHDPDLLLFQVQVK